MPENDWDVSKPIDHLKIGDVPEKIRDVKSSAKIIIAKEHVTPTTDNAGGEHAHGAARVYIQSALPTTDPEANNLETTVGPSTNTDQGRVSANTAESNELRVYIGTSAGVSTGWQNVRVARVKMAETFDANSNPMIGISSGTQAGQAIHVGQIDTTPLTGQFKISEPATGAKVQVAVLDPPTSDGHIVGKKFVDFSANTNQDADSATLAINVTYTAVNDGFVTVHAIYSGTSGVDIIATVAGNVVQRTTLVDNGNDGCLGFSVAAGETFIISDSAGTPSTFNMYWRSRGALSKPTK